MLKLSSDKKSNKSADQSSDDLPTLEQVFNFPKNKNIRTKEGIIRIYSDQDCRPDQFLIHYIQIDENKRRRGIFTNFLHFIASYNEINEILIIGMETYEIENCVKKITICNHPFVIRGGDAIWTRR